MRQSLSKLNLHFFQIILIILSASKIVFKATPQYISPGHTQSLKIRCSLVEDPVNPAFITRVVSIVVIRTNADNGVDETVASVTTYTPPTAHHDVKNLQVNGTTNSSTPGEDGYLELTWAYPTRQQDGFYACELTALDGGLQMAVFLNSLRVGTNEVTTRELLLYIADLEERVEELESRSTAVVQAGNVQTGTVSCNDGTKDYAIVFPKPYSRKPTVVTALAGVHDSGAYTFAPVVLSLTSKGFTLRCQSVHTTYVVWVAI